MTGLVLSGAVAFLVAGALVPLLVRFAVGRDLLDVPNVRSSHERPTPRLGGVAVITGCWVGALAVSPSGIGEWIPLLVAATLVGGVGLADDFLNLHFGIKAAAQVVVASSLLLASPPDALSLIPAPLALPLAVVGVVWISAVCNAFNFMDGIDGITGGVALVSAAFLLAITGGSVLPALAGAVAGFLVWNVSPASIFMGDAGSYFIGFLLAATAFYVPMDGRWSALPLLACLLVFTPYLFDTAFTIARRLSRGAGGKVFSAHREHIYQRITPDPSVHRRTSNLYYGLATLAGIAGTAVVAAGFGVIAGVVLAIFCCLVMSVLPRFLGDTVP